MEIEVVKLEVEEGKYLFVKKGGFKDLLILLREWNKVYVWIIF